MQDQQAPMLGALPAPFSSGSAPAPFASSLRESAQRFSNGFAVPASTIRDRSLRTASTAELMDNPCVGASSASVSEAAGSSTRRDQAMDTGPWEDFVIKDKDTGRAYRVADAAATGPGESVELADVATNGKTTFKYDTIGSPRSVASGANGSNGSAIKAGLVKQILDLQGSAPSVTKRAPGVSKRDAGGKLHRPAWCVACS